jgi:hypothetical protein
MSGSHRHYSVKKSRAGVRPARSILYLALAGNGDIKVGVTNDVKRRLYEVGRGEGALRRRVG